MRFQFGVPGDVRRLAVHVGNGVDGAVRPVTLTGHQPRSSSTLDPEVVAHVHGKVIAEHGDTRRHRPRRWEDEAEGRAGADGCAPIAVVPAAAASTADPKSVGGQTRASIQG